jgi:putative flippase GtrA
MSRFRQMSAFAGAGVFAAIAHYGVLLAAVELFRVEAVLASLIGFVAGGVVSYALNRRHTFAATRSHGAAGWRFAVVAFGGFLITGAVMALLVRHWGLPYLPAQIATTLLVMLFTFSAHKRWSFGEGR